MWARAAAALTVAAALGAAAPAQDAETAIRAALAQWTDDFNAGRADRVCGLFAADLRYDFRGLPERGYGELCELLHRALADPSRRFSYALTIKQVLVSGDLAVVRLVWRATVVRSGVAGAVTADEPGMDVFRRQPDGTWQIVTYLAYEDGR